MKHVRSASSSRLTAPAFIVLSRFETLQLRKLPWIARALFMELLSLANFVTGRINTSYAVLEALLDFDLAPTAHDVPKPSQRRVRSALEDLIALDLVSVDRIKNEKAKGLFLNVKSRAGISASVRKRDRLSDRPLNDANLDLARPARERPPRVRQTERQGVQEKGFIPDTPLQGAGEKAQKAKSDEEVRTTERDMRSLTLRPKTEATAPPSTLRSTAEKLKAKIAAKRSAGASSDRAPRSR